MAATAAISISRAMATRWIKVADDLGQFKLRELTYLGQQVEAVRRGNTGSVERLERFLE